MTIRVLVVDDQELLRTAISSLIDEEDDLEVVGEASDGREAVELVSRLSPDVVVMDVRMPGMDGIEAPAISPRGIGRIRRGCSFSRPSTSTSTSSRLLHLEDPCDPGCSGFREGAERSQLAYRTRAPGAELGRGRPFQRRTRREAARELADGKDSCEPDSHQARRTGSHPTCRHRLRIWARHDDRPA